VLDHDPVVRVEQLDRVEQLLLYLEQPATLAPYVRRPVTADERELTEGVARVRRRERDDDLLLEVVRRVGELGVDRHPAGTDEHGRHNGFLERLSERPARDLDRL
jgi:hypothetical protein